MILNIMDKLTEITDDFREWVIANSSPVLMVAIIVIGLAVFFITYNALHKNG